MVCLVSLIMCSIFDFFDVCFEGVFIFVVENVEDDDMVVYDLFGVGGCNFGN